MKRGGASTSIDLEHLDARGWAELDRVLEVVLELTPDAVEPALDRLCSGNEELKAQVRGVLAADRQGAAAAFLAKPAIEMTGAVSEHGNLIRRFLERCRLAFVDRRARRAARRSIQRE